MPIFWRYCPMTDNKTCSRRECLSDPADWAKGMPVCRQAEVHPAAAVAGPPVLDGPTGRGKGQS